MAGWQVSLNMTHNIYHTFERQNHMAICSYLDSEHLFSCHWGVINYWIDVPNGWSMHGVQGFPMKAIFRYGAFGIYKKAVI